MFTCIYEYHYVFTKGAGQYWERGTAGAGGELTQTLLSNVGQATTLSVFLLPSSPYHQ